MKAYLAIFLIHLLLLGNVGYVHATHYCGGQAVEQEWSLLVPEVGCGMPDALQNLKSSTEEHCQPEPCCQDQYQRFQLDTEAAAASMGVPLLLLLPKPELPRLHLRIPLAQCLCIQEYPLPPPLRPKPSVLYQVFRL